MKLPMSSIASRKVPTNFVMPTAIAPNEIPFSRSMIPLKLASPRFFAKELPSSLRILTMPLPIVLTAFHTADRS